MAPVSRHRAAVLASLALIALTVLDISASSHVVPVVLFVIAPLLVATRGHTRDTAVVAAVAVPLAIAVAVEAHTSTTGRWALAIAGVAAGGILAVWLADLR